MQTNLADFLRDTPDGEEADAILRKCVHCGFCTATCPTYQLLGDELDGPRGRIYLIKQMAEGAPVSRLTQTHLDRCLTCRNCESTCPSGVQYGRLVDIGRRYVDRQVQRPLGERAMRYVLANVVPNRRLFGALFEVGRRVRLALPAALRHKIPPRHDVGAWPTRTHARKMLMLAGCVQPAMMPSVNTATARVLDALGIETVVAGEAGCCGAIRLHLGLEADGLDDVRRNIDAWWPHVESGAEAIVMNASGCGATVKEYGHLLRNDPAYASKAQRISALTRDLAEILPDFTDQLITLAGRADAPRVAFHSPCTLQHGQQIRGKVEALLRGLGIDVALPADSHLCCGSAGTYSILQPALSKQLRDQKLASLHATQAEEIVSANIGCLCHLQSGTSTPVRHWVELIAQRL
ncbi:glycolate oxidase subunit GlcF [Pandoraea sp.]|uniref:glycolate oxidase subunit GlcF n=1 Tax=Pandoraea sp. TaxID=1883445 RepID=UPI0011F5A50F|nr:glycolate oxidase subunit GlcF [Pandoraea sp.]TAL54465.1 MAG: glycolate oxidase iron-sulfur subunit [Pandoraea sp.]TAM17513.1 MAG: glycolate oxidase iron-sulfur subunit [Pandoraea sp.]